MQFNLAAVLALALSVSALDFESVATDKLEGAVSAFGQLARDYNGAATAAAKQEVLSVLKIEIAAQNETFASLRDAHASLESLKTKISDSNSTVQAQIDANLQDIEAAMEHDEFRDYVAQNAGFASHSDAVSALSLTSKLHSIKLVAEFIVTGVIYRILQWRDEHH